jgi:hypothetical protein
MPSGETQYRKLYLEDLGMQILHALRNPSSISGKKTTRRYRTSETAWARSVMFSLPTRVHRFYRPPLHRQAPAKFRGLARNREIWHVLQLAS